MSALVGDVEALAEAIRDVLAQCTCTRWAPAIDCPMHGRADHQGEVIAAALFASGAVASRSTVEREAYQAGRRAGARNCGCAWCCATVPPDQRGETHKRTCAAALRPADTQPEEN